MGFAERLKELREDNDEKQKDIADLIHVSHSMISFYESGVHFPRDEKTLLAIASHFGVSMDYLMGISNIKNYEKSSQLMSDINSLSNESYELLLKYIEFLKFTDKNNSDLS